MLPWEVHTAATGRQIPAGTPHSVLACAGTIYFKSGTCVTVFVLDSAGLKSNTYRH